MRPSQRAGIVPIVRSTFVGNPKAPTPFLLFSFMKRDVAENHENGLPSSVAREVKNYYRLHPDGPAAMRHPRVVLEHGRYVALLGPSVKGGVIGFGTSVASALRVLDELYRKPVRAVRRSCPQINARGTRRN